MDIAVLSNFITICDCGSINKASRILHISQPPLSRQMHNLENELGAKLFIRTNSGIKLTQEGTLLYERSKALVSTLDLVAQEIKKCTRIVKFGATTSSIKYIANILRDEISDSNISFDITEKNTYELLDCLNNESIDFAFIRTPFNISNSFKTIELYRDELVLFGKKEFFKDFSDNENISLNSLYSKPIIVSKRWKEYLSISPDNTYQNLNFKFLCSDNRTSYAFAKDGVGIAILPSSEIEPDLKDCDIHSLENSFYKTSIYLVYKKDIVLDEVTEALISRISEKEIK